MNNTKYPEVVRQMKIHNEKLQDIADLLDQVNKSQISRRLSGKVIWTMKDARTLCKHYNMKIEDLFREEE